MQEVNIFCFKLIIQNKVIVNTSFTNLKSSKKKKKKKKKIKKKKKKKKKTRPYYRLIYKSSYTFVNYNLSLFLRIYLFKFNIY